MTRPMPAPVLIVAGAYWWIWTPVSAYVARYAPSDAIVRTMFGGQQAHWNHGGRVPGASARCGRPSPGAAGRATRRCAGLL